MQRLKPRARNFDSWESHEPGVFDSDYATWKFNMIRPWAFLIS